MLRFELKHLGGFNYQTNVVDFAGGEDGAATANGFDPRSVIARLRPWPRVRGLATL